ncbi:MAG: methyltransferase domain-containing protein [Tunicatimonas sp.]|uniref:methyltransferase domain-containing protein n=1 Tax=Tunicatimonas sp. TaxID=1940096 RepID=UPI003C74A307
MAKTYKTNFYRSRHNKTLYSAETIIKIISDIVNPKSVVDMGCGVGTWLEVFTHLGVEDVLGLEGHWVEDEKIVIPLAKFKKVNLEDELTLDRRFDLAISLEVAEHINEQYAERFVENLTKLAPVVMFSAAIPLQEGKYHVNEQWPDYWKAIFEEKGYLLVDLIRPQVWNDERIEMWYAQNTFVYVDRNRIADYPQLEALYVENPPLLSAVLPRFYEFKLKKFPIGRAIKNRIKRAL